MTIISDDPSWWPLINYASISSYFSAVCIAAVVYDWVSTFGREFELILRQRWSFMTVLYICVRYIGILNSVVYLLLNLPISVTDAVGTIIWFIQTWTPVIVNAMLGIIMIARINAMYQRSKKLLIFLVVLLGSTITSGVLTVIGNLGVSGQEAVLSGHHICITYTERYMLDRTYERLISTTVWEILALFLTVWIVIKHFRETRQTSTVSTIGACFMILAESHVFYFLAFATMACFTFGLLSPNTDTSSVGSVVYNGILSISQMLQTFVLGPRLILSIREYHAKLVARADGGTGISSIIFHAGEHALTGGDV
ncbi:uncharacterized protein F5147DRAFT_374261 [Suillus discolor]|uniref:DUF6533 domain-containing protein n=1 Tax=Suillus discolor TaxID=1912936 RepID=A0A9P7EZ37_9AGAM|nr:uncharacterized protein F5147DRAFT_374261 [Suillus discolor]KAG2097055.1 hypothetical protein F5147DRAFT_374261 [Suillus discolor]